MNFQAIATRYGVTLEQAAEIRAHIDVTAGIDWSEAGYPEIDRAVRGAAKFFGIELRSVYDSADARKQGMAAFRVKLLKAHKQVLAEGVDGHGKKLRAADVEFQKDIIATIERAQCRLGEVR